MIPGARLHDATLKKLPQLRAKRNLPDDARLKKELRRAVDNEAHNRLRLELRRAVVSLDDSPEPATEAELETTLAVRQALDALPRNEREVLVLAYIEGLTDTAIAIEFGVHQTTIGRWRRRAETDLRQTLGLDKAAPRRAGEAPKVTPKQERQAAGAAVVAAREERPQKQGRNQEQRRKKVAARKKRKQPRAPARRKKGATKR